MLGHSGIEQPTSYLQGKWCTIKLAPFKELCEEV